MIIIFIVIFLNQFKKLTMTFKSCLEPFQKLTVDDLSFYRTLLYIIIPKIFIVIFLNLFKKMTMTFQKRFVTLKRSNIFLTFKLILEIRWFFHIRFFIVIFLNQFKKLTMTLKSGFFPLIYFNIIFIMKNYIVIFLE